MQTYDALAMGLEFRGISISSRVTGVTLETGVPGPAQPKLSLNNGAEVQISFWPGAGKLTAGAYLAGVEIEIGGEPPAGTISIIQGTGAPGDPKLQTCPLVRGIQRCYGWANTLSPTPVDEFIVRVEYATQSGKPMWTPRLKKILVDVP